MREDEFQKKVVKELRKIPFIYTIFVQNEESSGKARYGSRNKAMGKTAGCSDLIVLNNKTKKIFFVEMKSYKVGLKGRFIGKTKQSPEQILFQNTVEKMGYKYFLIDSPIAEGKLYEEVVE